MVFDRVREFTSKQFQRIGSLSMCGRFNILATPEEIAHWFRVSNVPADFPRRYNIAPTQHIPVVRIGRGGGGLGDGDAGARAGSTTAGDRELEMMYWGLVPGWAKDPSMGARMINARSETVDEKPSFRNAFRSRRCLVVASGFYEWKKLPDGSKQPYHIRMHGGWMFAFAGLWEYWKPKNSDGDGEGAPIVSCTILTTEANEVLAPIHDRMPVILPPDCYETWLRGPTPGHDEDCSEEDEAGGTSAGKCEVDDATLTSTLKSLLVPFDPDNMEAIPISRRVNNVRNNDPQCITPMIDHNGERDTGDDDRSDSDSDSGSDRGLTDGETGSLFS